MIRPGIAALLVLLVSPASLPDRIRFDVQTVEESGAVRRILHRARIEGPPGVDFDLTGEDPRLRMTARFITDCIDPETVRIRVRLETRRLYGTSGRGLPVYEEETQRLELEGKLDQRLVLLPFGGKGKEVLRIEITPSASPLPARLPSGKPRPLEIDLIRPDPTGALRVLARKIPHRYRVFAELTAPDRADACGAGDAWLLDPVEIALGPAGEDSAEQESPRLVLTVEEFREEIGRAVEFRFDVCARDGKRLVSGWAGIASLGSNLTYHLPDPDPEGRAGETELRIRIEAHPEESR